MRVAIRRARWAARGRVRRHAFVGGWVGIVGIATAVAWVSMSNAGAARAAAPLGATRRAAQPQERALHLACSRSCFVRDPYEIDYSGTETLDTLRPVPSQVFYQAGRKLYIKLKWDLKVFKTKDTGVLVQHGLKVSGIVDLTIPDSPTNDCTAPYSLDAAIASDELDNTYISIIAGPKALVWTLGIPEASAACNDSSVNPGFPNPTFRFQFEQAAGPHFSVPCERLNKAGGTWSKAFDFGPRANPAELSTVGLGQMDVTIRSKVVVKGAKCSAAGLIG
jgi:hypothetical protein